MSYTVAASQQLAAPQQTAATNFTLVYTLNDMSLQSLLDAVQASAASLQADGITKPTDAQYTLAAGDGSTSFGVITVSWSRSPG